jgi:transcriptional regulator with XRE-family HTH domain
MSNEKLRKVEEAFSDRLKMLRRERGWSQEDLATKLDVSPGSVGNWEMGPHTPHAKTLKKIASLFEVEVFYLLEGERGQSRHAAMQEKAPAYGTVDLAGLLREVEGARDSLERIVQQLKKAAVKPSAAQGLAGMASANYDHRQGSGKNRGKETGESEAKRLVTKAEKQQVK